MPETASLKNGIAAVGFQIVIPGGRFKKIATSPPAHANRVVRDSGSSRIAEKSIPSSTTTPGRRPGAISPSSSPKPNAAAPPAVAHSRRSASGTPSPSRRSSSTSDNAPFDAQRIGSHTDIQPVRPQQLHRRAQSRDIPVRTRAEAPPHGCREVRRHAVDRPLRHTAIVDEQHAARGRDAPDEPFDRRARNAGNRTASPARHTTPPAPLRRGRAPPRPATP